MNLNEIMGELAKERPIFHSEADFQHALAWKIHQKWPDCSMRLEYTPQHLDDRMYLDLWVTNEDSTIAIELKYFTRGIQATFNNEVFKLKEHAARDMLRYDFLKDIVRLERVVSGQSSSFGYSILLTNDSALWNEPRSTETIDTDFMINNGRGISGVLKWSEKASKGSIKKRENPIEINTQYKLDWKDYSQLGVKKYGEFRYLLVEVGR